MRNAVVMSIAGMMLMAFQVQAEEPQQFKTQKEKVSYAIGVDLVRNFKKQGIEADLDLVIKGMRDGSTGAKLLISDAGMSKSLSDYQQELAGKQAQLKVLAAENNKRDGAVWLAANKGREGVVALPSGLQYKVIKAGDGKKPGDTDSVTCRYRGTLIDGTEFDSSESLGFPVTFNVKDSAIAGWSEALKQMPAGSKWQVFIPPQLGYGEKGAGRDIGPNATLIYEIELIAVNPQQVVLKNKDGSL
jgi:FKBP-type peptidyl-prolyl cis-trans isomerase FklB